MKQHVLNGRVKGISGAVGLVEKVWVCSNVLLNKLGVGRKNVVCRMN